ncbi:MAG: hypothetical protein KC877_02660 [Candidatus Kaiserbacteria bacterium]|nr:hypothetical protein [Candidatus Kaiserbacteria bacterium]MCB9816135.1 hypothetical protein [Candidatus Nomurabacteria bacterium]
MSMTHHAVLLRTVTVADHELSPPEKVEVQDVYIERFGIDDARQLVRTASQRPAEAAEQLLIVRTEFITHEAQNALLKILEEPPVSTRFTFIVPRDFMMLDTLASRVSEVQGEKEEGSTEVFDSFMQLSYKDRITSIEQAMKQKDTVWQRAMKQGLIRHIEKGRVESSALETLEFAARLLLTRGAANKMLLEQVALTLPVR